MNQQPDAITGENILVELNEADNRYEIKYDGRFAGYAEYRESPSEIAFTHTETLEEFSGMGLGKSLVAGALADAATRDRTIVPYCPFVAKYIKHNPEAAPNIRWPDSPRMR